MSWWGLLSGMGVCSVFLNWAGRGSCVRLAVVLGCGVIVCWVLCCCRLWCCFWAGSGFTLLVASVVSGFTRLLCCVRVFSIVRAPPSPPSLLCCGFTLCLRASVTPLTPFLMSSHALPLLLCRFCCGVPGRCVLPKQSQRPPGPPFTSPSVSPSSSNAVSAFSVQALLSSPPGNLPV